jgi:hypothetical protein
LDLPRLSNNHWKGARYSSLKADTYPIGIDSNEFASKINLVPYFILQPKSIDFKIRGIEGHSDTSKINNVSWSIQDELEIIHIYECQEPTAIVITKSPEIR